MAICMKVAKEREVGREEKGNGKGGEEREEV